MGQIYAPAFIVVLSLAELGKSCLVHWCLGKLRVPFDSFPTLIVSYSSVYLVPKLDRRPLDTSDLRLDHHHEYDILLTFAT
ncbi:hypothetical protein EDB89DRAFT_1930192 [Lactarius sanguifluus]|nr:hypothetical protein EDB89DRAFT_1930192 [Lactarius sanguifluus]